MQCHRWPDRLWTNNLLHVMDDVPAAPPSRDRRPASWRPAGDRRLP